MAVNHWDKRLSLEPWKGQARVKGELICSDDLEQTENYAYTTLTMIIPIPLRHITG